MAWEQRGNGFYYYKKVRQGKKVISIYLGNGEFARLLGNDELARLTAHGNELLKINRVKEKLRLTELKQYLIELKAVRKTFRKFPTYQEKIDKQITFLKTVIKL